VSLNPKEIREKIHTDPDYVYCKRYGYSLDKMIERFDGPIPDHTIAQSLLISTEDLDELYSDIVSKLRVILGVI